MKVTLIVLSCIAVAFGQDAAIPCRTVVATDYNVICDAACTGRPTVTATSVSTITRTIPFSCPPLPTAPLAIAKRDIIPDYPGLKKRGCIPVTATSTTTAPCRICTHFPVTTTVTSTVFTIKIGPVHPCPLAVTE
ncbi:hypothetical protein PIIN_03862 [Serendipita indica DSM 11827]|uniref:Uncharacterized protein n=1 Tax=Serendipita indica (strain DSM 11827) TaxID=1109443 RepID=G4TF27_SERID|nr:hypothetical protein PIIN_03862 [Serendipita indica DSM 11827]